MATVARARQTAGRTSAALEDDYVTKGGQTTGRTGIASEQAIIFLRCSEHAHILQMHVSRTRSDRPLLVHLVPLVCIPVCACTTSARDRYPLPFGSNCENSRARRIFCDCSRPAGSLLDKSAQYSTSSVSSFLAVALGIRLPRQSCCLKGSAASAAQTRCSTPDCA
eukprot:1241298-Pleurochrysis_carterae.AAC.1